MSINGAIEHASGHLIELLEHKLEEMTSFKFSTVLGCEYVKQDVSEDPEEDPERMVMNFRSRFATAGKFDDLSSILAPPLLGMEANADQFTANGSNWNLMEVLYMEVEIGACFPFSGSCTSLHIIKAEKNIQIEKDGSLDQPDLGRSDGRCFFHAIASYFNEGVNEIELLEDFIRENFVINISWPVEVKSIKKFELDNKHLECSINVIYQNEYNHLYPVYISQRNPYEGGGKNIAVHVINLLLFHVNSKHYSEYSETNIEVSDSESEIEDGEENINIGPFAIGKSQERHYALVKNLNKIIAKFRLGQITDDANELIDKKHKQIKSLESQLEGNSEAKEEDIQRNSEEKRQLIAQLQKEISDISLSLQTRRRGYNYSRCNMCYNCFSVFSTSEALKNHQMWCFKEDPVVPIIPARGETDEFELKSKHIMRPITFYCDFEALQVKPKASCGCNTDESFDAGSDGAQNSTSDSPNECPHNTKVCYEQKPFAYCIIVVNHEGKVKDVIDYCGEDAKNQFLNDLLDLEQKYQIYLQYKVPMTLTDEEEARFQATTECHICEHKIKPHHLKVRDHCHNRLVTQS